MLDPVAVKGEVAVVDGASKREQPMPILTVQMRRGRSRDAKRELIRTVTDAVVASIGAKRENVRVLIHEVDDEHFGVGGISYAERESGS